MKYIVDGNNLEELQIVVREPHGKDRIIEFKGDTDNLVQMSDVNLYDWDGTLLFAYTKDNFLKMTDYPIVAAPEGMIVQGWNWSFEGAQNYVRKYGMVNVGRVCYPDLPEEKKHALLMEMHIPEGGHTDIPLLFSQSVSHGVEIDWGDGSEFETVEGEGLVTTSHQYTSDNAVYTIAVKAMDGCEIVYGDRDTERNIFGGDTGRYNFVFMSYVKSIIIPENITTISNYAFLYSTTLQSIIIPEGVTSIGKYAFINCYNLKFLIIPNSIINIEEYSFANCFALQTLILPECLANIGTYAFYSCYILKFLTIPEDITTIPDRTFCYANLIQNLIIPSKVINIGAYAFGNCIELKSITFLEGFVRIGEGAFTNCFALQNINVHKEIILDVGDYAFSNCVSLKSLRINDGIENIRKEAFRHNRYIKNLIIPNGISTIKDRSFQYWFKLQSVTIPVSVESIEIYAFDECFALNTIIMLGETPPVLGHFPFEKEGSKDLKIYVPYSEDHSILEAYKTAPSWAAYADYIVESEHIEESTPEIENPAD